MVDNVLMRIVDFIMILPTMMIIIVVVTIIPRYNVWSFIAIMSAFYRLEKRDFSVVKHFLKVV